MHNIRLFSDIRLPMFYLIPKYVPMVFDISKRRQNLEREYGFHLQSIEAFWGKQKEKFTHFKSAQAHSTLKGTCPYQFKGIYKIYSERKHQEK